MGVGGGDAKSEMVTLGVASISLDGRVVEFARVSKTFSKTRGLKQKQNKKKHQYLHSYMSSTVCR